MLKTVEIPLSGHPDKVCDQIVEALLDEHLRRDPNSRVSLKACGSHGMLMVGGTVDSRADVDAAAIVKRVYKEIGYDDDIEPFVNIERPSEDVARQMVKGGVQGTCGVYGYATKETREFLPRAYVYATALARRIDDLRKHDPHFAFLRPDGKVQLTMDGEKIVSVTLLVQHDPSVDRGRMQSLLLEQVIVPVLGEQDGVQIFVNSAGAFENGGFWASAGASGRKTSADTYGGLLPHGGVAFSGKDPLHPCRAGAYMARHAAKALVQDGVAGNVLIHATYTIGTEEPVSLQAVTGAGKDVTDQIRERFDFRPESIVETLDLRRPQYQDVSVYGSFGRAEVPWEEKSN